MPVLAQIPGQAEAVFAGQADVQHHDIYRFAVDDMTHVDAVAGGADAKAMTAEIAAQDPDDLDIVIDHQQVRRRYRG